ncbi:hypothetical protein KEM54_006524 [Ascosphaera aggregata]|nr:hypothetical protein KEM54_006524 [Ascosphaera aggregata]
MKRNVGRDISPPPLKRRRVEAVQVKETKFTDFFTPISQKSAVMMDQAKMIKGQRQGQKQIVWGVINQTCLAGTYNVSSNQDDNEVDADHPSTGIPNQITAKVKRIAAFDLDSTLIKTKSGFLHPRHGNDWIWWSSSVPSVLQGLHREGYLLAILTNQKAVSLRKQVIAGKADSKSVANLKQRLTGVIKALDLPLVVYAATEDDKFRKPAIGMWNLLVGRDGYDIERDLALGQCIFVGDAAGRKGDHSAADRDFAMNAGIPFRTPEEIFLGQQTSEVTATTETTESSIKTADAYGDDMPTSRQERQTIRTAVNNGMLQQEAYTLVASSVHYSVKFDDHIELAAVS